jgi:DNA-binding PadR family transcriptional regulator
MSRGDRKLPAGDFVFLSFLLLGPMSAYEIKKGMEGSVSHFWSMAHSQVYQQAARLARDGYVKDKAAPGGRRKRILSLAPKGRRAVIEWLRSPATEDQLFSELLVKVFFAAQAGDLAATRGILDEQRRKDVEMLASYEGFLPMLQKAEQNPFPAMTLDAGIRYYRSEIAWIDDTIRRIDDLARR